MGYILNIVKQFFRDEDWAFTEASNDIGLQLNFGGNNGQWRCYARVREPEGQVIFYSYAPFEIPESKRIDIALFITQANFGLHIGDFELNVRNGTLQFKTSIDVKGSENSLNTRLMKHLVYANVITFDRYLPGLQAMLEQDMSPADAIKLTD